MKSLLTFIGGAGLVTLISIVVSIMESHVGHDQHQKDVTIKEIQILKEQIDKYNLLIKKNSNNLDKLFNLKLQLLAYLSMWSTNVAYNRVNNKMISYALHPLLKQEFNILNNDLLILLKLPKYHSITKNTLVLFRKCDIISLWKEWLLCLQAKK